MDDKTRTGLLALCITVGLFTTVLGIALVLAWKPGPAPPPSTQPTPAPKPAEQMKESKDAFNRQTDPDSRASELVSIDPGLLHGAFRENELRADKTYTGKTIEIVWVVERVEKKEGKYVAVIQLPRSLALPPHDDILCFISAGHTDRFTQPIKGKVRIRGVCAGYNKAEDCVLLNECRLVD